LSDDANTTAFSKPTAASNTPASSTTASPRIQSTPGTAASRSPSTAATVVTVAIYTLHGDSRRTDARNRKSPGPPAAQGLSELIDEPNRTRTVRVVDTNANWQTPAPQQPTDRLHQEVLALLTAVRALTEAGAPHSLTASAHHFARETRTRVRALTPAQRAEVNRRLDQGQNLTEAVVFAGVTP
jgi:hypothetical protein